MIPAQAKDAMEVWLAKAIAGFDDSRFNDGDILTHDWLQWALDIPEPATVAEAQETQWLTLQRVDAFRDYLLVNRSIALQSVRGQGSWIVPPSEQARVAAHEAMKQVRKGLERGDKLLTHARLSEMDSAAQRRHTDTQVRLSGIGQLMKRQKKDLLTLFKSG